MKLSFRQAVFLGNKVLIGLQVETLMFQAHCGLSYHHSSDTCNGSMSGWKLAYVHCGGPAMAFPTSLHFLMLPSSSGTLSFLRTFSLSIGISTLVLIHVPGTIMSVRVHDAMCSTGLPGQVGLKDWSCCS